MQNPIIPKTMTEGGQKDQDLVTIERDALERTQKTLSEKHDHSEFGGILPIKDIEAKNGTDETRNLWNDSVNLAWGLRVYDAYVTSTEVNEDARMSSHLVEVTDYLESLQMKNDYKLVFLTAYNFHSQAYILAVDRDIKKRPPEDEEEALEYYKEAGIPAIDFPEPSERIRGYILEKLIDGIENAEAEDSNLKFADVVAVMSELANRGFSEYSFSGENIEPDELIGDTYLSVEDFGKLWEAFTELHNRMGYGPFTRVDTTEAGYTLDGTALEMASNTGLDIENNSRYAQLMKIGKRFEEITSKK